MDGAVDTRGSVAWRRPVWSEDVWVVQGNPAHTRLLDAMVSTHSVRVPGCLATSDASPPLVPSEVRGVVS